MMVNWKRHWNTVYAGKRPEELSWFQSEPEVSLSLIRRTELSQDAEILDVGGGASSLSSALLKEGFRNTSVLDISSEALSVARTRMGSSATKVEWIEADILGFKPDSQWSLWHDRAVFHFLISPEERRAYLRTLTRGLKPGGHLILATFSLDGPSCCSGLDCVRYSPETLSGVLGAEFLLRESVTEAHKTPSGGTQNFVYSWFQRSAGT